MEKALGEKIQRKLNEMKKEWDDGTETDFAEYGRSRKTAKFIRDLGELLDMTEPKEEEIKIVPDDFTVKMLTRMLSLDKRLTTIELVLTANKIISKEELVENSKYVAKELREYYEAKFEGYDFDFGSKTWRKKD